MVGCRCAVCRSADPRNRRRRASLLLQDEGRSWVIDTGPDFRVQALDAGLETVDAVLLTHAHADHLLGLDDLRPLSWKQAVPVFCDAETEASVRRVFPYFFQPPNGKNSRPNLSLHRLVPEVPLTAAGLGVLPVPIRHGDDQILGFRVGGLAYLTDCNGIPEASLALLRGLEVLVLGALRTKPHPTHFSLAEAVEAARLVGARRSLFTHFSHDVDHGVWAASLPEGFAPAYDGLTVEFSR